MTMTQSSLTKTRILSGPFKGAYILADWRTAKRKIFGIYEQQLNKWLTLRVGQCRVFLDVGANNGYHTFGFAHAKQRRSSEKPVIIAVEPVVTPELTEPLSWPEYKSCDIRIVQKYASDTAAGDHTTIDSLITDFDAPTLVKMDIEGFETDALKGASRALASLSVHWIIEIHEQFRIPLVAGHFVAANRPFLILDESTPAFVGPEPRSLYTSWLVTL